MSAFTVHYQTPPVNQEDKQRKKAAVKMRMYELLLETCVTILLLVSVSANVILYNHTQSLQRQNNQQIIQYDSLLSTKLLLDKELMEAKDSLQIQVHEENLLRILPVESGSQGYK